MFAVGGNAGFAIGLLFVSAVLIAAGVCGTAFLAVPAVITGVIVYLVLIRRGQVTASRPQDPPRAGCR